MVTRKMVTRTLALFILLTSTLLSQDRNQQFAAGDLLFRPESAFTGRTPALLWTGARVPYIVDPAIPTPTRITDAVAYYNSNTPVTFQPRAGEANFVHFLRST